MIMLFSLVSCAAFITMLTVYEWETIKDSFKNISKAIHTGRLRR